MSGAIYDAPLTSLAFCWRLTRRDGVTIGFTTHDRDVEAGGILYRAAPGMLPSAIIAGTDGSADGMDVKGVLDDAAIREEDLKAGRWDGARLSLFLMDWDDPGADWMALAEGEIGAVERQGRGFTAELRGPGAVLERAIVPETSPSCRAMLGDRDCRVDLARWRVIAQVTGVAEERLSFAPGVLDGGRFAGGEVRWLSGAACGLRAGIVAQEGAGVTVEALPGAAVRAGDRVRLTQGCDKQLATCAARFGNVRNFRGEPHLPGNDLLTRYGG